MKKSEWINWNASKAFAPVFDKTGEQRLALVDSLGDSYVANGFKRPKGYDLRYLVHSSRVHPSVLVQDTGGYRRESTRKPVEKLLAALVKAQEALDECRTIGELESPPGHFNVARLLTEHADISYFKDMKYLVESVLDKGITPEKHEPFYAYDAFIWRVMEVCDPAPRERAPFVKLLLACEVTLPKSYRALTKEKVGKRFDEFRKRLASEPARFAPRLPQPMTLEEFIEDSRPYLEPPP